MISSPAPKLDMVTGSWIFSHVPENNSSRFNELYDLTSRICCSSSSRTLLGINSEHIWSSISSFPGTWHFGTFLFFLLIFLWPKHAQLSMCQDRVISSTVCSTIKKKLKCQKYKSKIHIIFIYILFVYKVWRRVAPPVGMHFFCR